MLCVKQIQSNLHVKLAAYVSCRARVYRVFCVDAHFFLCVVNFRGRSSDRRRRAILHDYRQEF